jgi:dipeptidyl aminopeptidase/acylaminoacyl peptidase
MKERRMFGLWESPVTPLSVAAGLRLSEPCWDTDGRTLAWVEGRSDRGVIVVQEDGEAPRDLTPGGMSVGAFVGYGGGDFTLAHGAAYFVGKADQRLYRQDLSGGPPRPITPAFGAAASPAVSPDGRWVAYVHTYEDRDCIAVVDCEGREWPVRLASGRDFFMQPAWHPGGDRLAWVEWDHPNMPWDGTDLCLANLGFPAVGLPRADGTRIVAGGPEIAVSQPTFSPDGCSLLFISDSTGFGHVHRLDLASGAEARLTEAPGEFGRPAWNQGSRNFAVTAAGSVVGVRGVEGFDRLVVVGPDGATREEASEGYTSFTAPAASSAHERVAFVAGGGTLPSRVVVVDVARPGAAPAVCKRSDTESVPRAWLSEPQAVSWPSFDGEEAFGLYYPPASGRFESEGPAPLVVIPHGGPTSQVTAAWSAQAQYLATRGYGVLYPNYRGSTGYGRAYMLKLRQSWGVYDVQDCKSGAEALVSRGLADASRLVIWGQSAGGYTVLQSLVDLPGFYKAAVCLYGVSNQFTLASDTHKFEARYTDSLIGPLPEAAKLYRERSPIFHASRIVDPVALFQGSIDRVVTRDQSDSIAASLRARGVPHEYHVYEGEGHGWRKSETIEQFWKAADRFLRQYVLFS